jgi:hypothetical protein
MAMVAGCAAPVGMEASPADVSRPKADRGSDALKVEGSLGIDFCPTGTDGNFYNALWLSHLSANAYARFGVLAENLGELGFGEPGEAEWLAGCFAAAEELRFGGESTDPCYARWAEAEPRAAASSRAADLFEHYLIHDVHDGWNIELLSDAELDDDGLRWRSTQALFARHGTLPFAVVAFRGTEDLSDGLVDGDFLRKGFWIDWTYTKVHSGFSEALDPVEPMLRRKLRELGDDVNVWVTGHSLGAALATLFVARLMDTGDDDRVRGLYTFGSPRVGNGAFAEVFERLARERRIDLMRFHNRRDPVVHMPPRFGTSYYYHVTDNAYFDADGRFNLGTERFVPPPSGDIDQYERQLAGLSEEDYRRAVDRLSARERSLVRHGVNALADAGDALFAPHAATLYHANIGGHLERHPIAGQCE